MAKFNCPCRVARCCITEKDGFKASVRVRLAAVLKELGLMPTEAITLFYKQVTLHRGLPFAVELPTAEREAMRDALAGRDLREWPDIEALKAAHR
jgi:DNA-damage-inducible protein J